MIKSEYHKNWDSILGEIKTIFFILLKGFLLVKFKVIADTSFKLDWYEDSKFVIQ